MTDQELEQGKILNTRIENLQKSMQSITSAQNDISGHNILGIYISYDNGQRKNSRQNAFVDISQDKNPEAVARQLLNALETRLQTAIDEAQTEFDNL